MDENKQCFSNLQKISTSEVSVEDREALINKIAQVDDDEKKRLAWSLVSLNYALVFHVIQQSFAGYKNQKNAIVSDGILGLYNACIRVKSNTSNREFAGYASKYIFGYIMEGLKKRKGVVRYPHYKNIKEKPNDVSIDALVDDEGNKFEIVDYDFDCFQSVYGKSNAEFCDNFIERVIKHYKKHKPKHTSFFGNKCLDVLKALSEKEESKEVCEACGQFKQRVDQVKKDTFVYIVQKLRDGDPKETKGFFDVVYDGKYSLQNPPPFDAWRKIYWDRIINDPDKSFKASTHYTQRNTGYKKKGKQDKNKN